MRSSDIDFITNTVCKLIQIESPPRLQALLRMINTKVREVQSQQYKDMSSLEVLAPFMAEAINNPNADVRKCVVFCLVEIYNVLGPDLFLPFSEHLNSR